MHVNILGNIHVNLLGNMLGNMHVNMLGKMLGNMQGITVCLKTSYISRGRRRQQRRVPAKLV